MSTLNTRTNIKISNNRVSFVSAIDTNALYYYYSSDGYVRSQTGSTVDVENNIFNGASTGTTNILIIDTSFCNVRNNKFFRGNASITSYISSNVAAVVTDNFFDSPTVDGTSESLVSLPSGSIYERNYNQTSYVPIGLSTSKYFAYGGSYTVTSRKFELDYLAVSNSNTSEELFSIQFDIGLKKYIPNGCKILTAIIGMYANSAVTDAVSTTTPSSFTISISNTVPLTTSISSPTSTIADARYQDLSYRGIDPATTVNGTGFTLTTSSDLTALSTASKYLSLDLTGNSFYVTNSVDALISIIYNITLLASSATLPLIQSPLVVKYRYLSSSS